MVRIYWKVVLKYLVVVNGLLFVMMAGMMMMPKLSVDSWDFLLKVKLMDSMITMFTRFIEPLSGVSLSIIIMLLFK